MPAPWSTMSLDFSDSFSDLSQWPYVASGSVGAIGGRSGYTGGTMRRFYWTRTSKMGVHIDLIPAGDVYGTSTVLMFDSGTYNNTQMTLFGTWNGSTWVLQFMVGSTVLGFVPVSTATNVWTTLDIYLEVSSTAGVLQVWVNGASTPSINLSGINTQNDPSTTNVYGVSFYWNAYWSIGCDSLQVYRPASIPAYSPLALPSGSPLSSMPALFTETFANLSAWTVVFSGGAVTTATQPGGSSPVDCLEFGAGQFSAYRNTTNSSTYGLRFQARSTYPAGSNSANSFFLLQSPSGAGTQIMVWIDPQNSRLQIYRGAGTANLIVSMPLVSMPLGEWVSVDLVVKVGSTGSIYCWMAGKCVCLVDGLNTLGDSAHPTIGRVVIANSDWPIDQYLANVSAYASAGTRRPRSQGYFQGV